MACHYKWPGGCLGYKSLIGPESLSVACSTKRIKRCVPLHCDIALTTHEPGKVACHLKRFFTVLFVTAKWATPTNSSRDSLLFELLNFRVVSVHFFLSGVLFAKNYYKNYYVKGLERIRSLS